MRKRKLYQLLALLSPEELNRFEAFLSTRYFNGRKTLLPFFARWRKLFFTTPDDRDYSVEEFLKGTGISPRRMNKLSSALYNLLVQFMAHSEMMEDEYALNELLVNAIERRSKRNPVSSSLLEKLQAQFDAEPDGPRKRYLSLVNRWMQAEVAIKTRETRALWKEDFQDINHRLDQYYQLQKLKLASASANARNIYNQKEKDPSADFLRSLRETGDVNQLPPLARCYYLTIQMLNEVNGEAAFRELIALLKDHASDFQVEEALELYNYALNFCIRSGNRGKLVYLHFAADLYQQLLDNRLILVNGQLHPQQFKNIVSLYCRLGMVDRAARFIPEYQHFLPETSRSFSVAYNKAVLSFFQGKYGDAIGRFKALVSQASGDIFYELDSRAYLWKSYFENLEHNSMAEMDEMYRLYDSFRLYIDRNEKLSDYHKLHYRNFIRMFKRFMEILNREPVPKDQLTQLRQDVTDLDSISHKEWFLSKIENALFTDPYPNL